ncbi:diguanylate cyclase [Alcaligenaceae bacterium SJ-26]|nr:diguanylate cyclase [Alcaligenaceae bacterium SJ-26]
MSSPPPLIATPHDNRARSLSFVNRIYRMRIVGTGLYMLPIASVLMEQVQPPAWIWAALIINGLIWPHIAWWLARRAEQPLRQEFGNLIADTALAGAWIALMHVSLVPTIIIVSILSADRIAAGGLRLLKKTLIAIVAGFVLTWTCLGYPFQPESSLRTIAACFPFLFIYGVSLSYVTHQLARQIARQNRELERLSRLDPALGLPNRRYFEDRAQHAMSLFKRTGQHASLLLIDVDHFKSINDRYGHAVGDAVLQAVASTLARAVRDIDLAARYGGDEFAVLLAATEAKSALEIGERIRQQVEKLTFEGNPELRCSISIGSAQLQSSHSMLRDWIADADSAMYRAKQHGRNQAMSV